jgi:ligand-binding sensor domain-containing protein
MLYARFLLLLILFPLRLVSQTNYVFHHLTVEDGLSENLRVNGFQDKEGYYWFSSTSGIQRFDGKNFITYLYPENSNKNSLAEWSGRAIEDKMSNILVVSEQGVNIYQRIHHSLTKSYSTGVNESNVNNLTALIKDSQSNIWEITDRSIYKYNGVQKKADLFAHILSDPKDYIFKAARDTRNDVCWLLIVKQGELRLCWFDFKVNRYGFVANPDLDQFLNGKREIAFFNVDNQHNVWLADYSGNLFRFNTVDHLLEKYPVFRENDDQKNSASDYIIHDFLDDNNGNIWFGGESSGLLKYDIKQNTFSRIGNDNGSPYGLHFDQTIYSFFKDREGNIWIDTDLGMNIFNPHLQQFSYFSHFKSIPSEFNANVLSIFESSTKDIWISTGGYGIFKFDSNFVFRHNYIHQNQAGSSLGEPLNRVWCFGEDSKKRIWVGSYRSMLSILDVRTGKFSNKSVPEFNQSTIMHMCCDSTGNFWFGLYNGTLGKYNAQTEKFSVYKIPYADNRREATIIDGLMIKGNKIMLSTSMNGLKTFDTEKGLSDTGILPSQHVFNVHVLNDTTLIGGTAGKGVFIYDIKSNTSRFVNIQNGLTSNIIYSAFPTKSGNAWIFANNGIDRLNLSSEKLFHYGSNDGIKDHIILKASCKLSNGRFLVATNSGIMYFNPDSILDRPVPPDVLITDFHSESQNYSIDSISQGQVIQLPYSQNDLTIEFSSISFLGRKTDLYFYKLKGIDKNWIASDLHRSVAYANLAPGDYHFLVKVQNADGIESLHETALNFSISSPWWRTGWASLLWCLLTGTVLYTLFDYRRKNRKALADVRQRIASDLHDDIGSTLNSVSVYSEIASRDLETNPENARLLLEKMGSSSRNMIDTMNDIVWSINPENDSFESTLLRMQYFAGELLSGKNIFLQFIADENVKNIKLPVKKRKNLYLIFKESINNAYKYSGCNMVNVSITNRGNYIDMIITDDGSGFELPITKVGGNGLLNMHLRAKEVAASIFIQSWPAKGTRIELQLPV